MQKIQRQQQVNQNNCWSALAVLDFSYHFRFFTSIRFVIMQVWELCMCARGGRGSCLNNGSTKNKKERNNMHIIQFNGSGSTPAATSLSYYLPLVVAVPIRRCFLFIWRPFIVCKWYHFHNFHFLIFFFPISTLEENYDWIPLKV